MCQTCIELDTECAKLHFLMTRMRPYATPEIAKMCHDKLDELVTTTFVNEMCPQNRKGRERHEVEKRMFGIPNKFTG